MNARIYLLLPLALLLAACQDRSSEESSVAAQDGSASTPASSPSQEPAPEIQTGKPFTDPLPAGVTLSFPHHARSVKEVETEEGAALQRFTMEFLGGTMEEAVANLTSDMERAGFVAAKPREHKSGGYRLKFSREGYGDVVAVVREVDPAKYRHPNAAGATQLYFPTQATDASK